MLDGQGKFNLSKHLARPVLHLFADAADVHSMLGAFLSEARLMSWWMMTVWGVFLAVALLEGVLLRRSTKEETRGKEEQEEQGGK